MSLRQNKTANLLHERTCRPTRISIKLPWWLLKLKERVKPRIRVLIFFLSGRCHKLKKETKWQGLFVQKNILYFLLKLSYTNTMMCSHINPDTPLPSLPCISQTFPPSPFCLTSFLPPSSTEDKFQNKSKFQI